MSFMGSRRALLRRDAKLSIVSADTRIAENTLNPSTSLQMASCLPIVFGATTPYIRFAYDTRVLTTSAPGYSDSPTPTTIVKVAFKYNGLVKPITFYAQRSATLPGGTVRYLSDPLRASKFGLANFVKNTYGWHRGATLLPSSAGRFLTGSSATYSGPEGTALCYRCDPANYVDQVDSPDDMTVPPGGTVSNFGWGPSAVLGPKTDRRDISVIAVTDSIGWRDDPDPTGGPAERLTGNGWLSRAAIAADGTLVDCIATMHATKVGATTANLNGSWLRAYYRHADVAIEEDGTNSFGTSGASATPADVYALLTARRTTQRAAGVRKVIRTKLAPKTSSASGKWNGDQTYVGNWGAGGNAGTFNALLDADFAAGRIDGLLSFSSIRGDLVNGDAYRWNENGVDNDNTVDGIHPAKRLQIAMANEWRSYAKYLRGGWSREITAWAASCAVAPSEDRLALLSALRAKLVSAGAWPMLDVVWTLAAHDVQAAKLTLNKAGNFTLVAAGSPNFVADRGFDGDGIDNTLNSGWAPATNGVRFALNGASFIWGAQNNGPSSVPDFGTVSGVANNRNVSLVRSNGTIATLRLNDNNDTQFANTAPKGLYLANRSGTTVALWKIGPTGGAVQLGAATVAPTLVTVAPMQLLHGPATTQWSAAAGAFFFAAGGDLSGKEATTLAAIRDWAVAIGAFS